MGSKTVTVTLTAYEAEMARQCLRIWEPHDESTKREIRAIERAELKLQAALYGAAV